MIWVHAKRALDLTQQLADVHVRFETTRSTWNGRRNHIAALGYGKFAVDDQLAVWHRTSPLHAARKLKIKEKSEMAQLSWLSVRRNNKDGDTGLYSGRTAATMHNYVHKNLYFVMAEGDVRIRSAAI